MGHPADLAGEARWWWEIGWEATPAPATPVGPKLIPHTRSVVDGLEVDVTSYGRFLDRFVQDGGRWRILRRNAVYEKDRLDPVRPGAALRLDEAPLARFPEGYLHLAYTQTKAGRNVDPGLPTPRSAALEKLVRDAEDWLAT